MKKLALAALLAAPLASPALADHHAGDGMRGVDGVYGGSYTCADGEHGFFLQLSKGDSILDSVGDRVEVVGWNVEGVLGFFPTIAGKDEESGMVAGSFEVSGLWSTNDKSIVLEPGNWLVQPEGYGAASMEGTLSEIAPGQWQIVGKPVVPGAPDFCTNLIATQFLPTMED